LIGRPMDFQTFLHQMLIEARTEVKT